MLPASIFCNIRVIFDKYSKGLLKGQKPSRSKKSQEKALELKGSNFKCLRGIETSTAHSLLTELSEGQMSFLELQAECQTIKQLSKMQAAFVKATNSRTWEEACEKYPKFTSTDKFEPYKKLNFSNPTIPEEFMKFCQIAIKCTSNNINETAEVYDDDDIFLLTYKCVFGVFCQKGILGISTNALEDIFEKVNIYVYACMCVAMHVCMCMYAVV